MDDDDRLVELGQDGVIGHEARIVPRLNVAEKDSGERVGREVELDVARLRHVIGRHDGAEVRLAYSSNHFWYSGAGKVAPAPVSALASPSNGPPIETDEPWANAASRLKTIPTMVKIEIRVRDSNGVIIYEKTPRQRWSHTLC